MRFAKYFPIAVFFIILFACKKNEDAVTYKPNFYFLNGGTGNLDKNLILFPSADSVTYNLIITSTYYVSSDVLVTIAAADSYRDSYNSANGTSYAALPPGSYKFRDTVTFTPSKVYDTIPVTLYKNALSSGVTYMLPLQITNAGENSIDPSSSVVYLNTTDNKLSGIYDGSGVKISYTGNASDSSVDATDSFNLVKIMTPVNANTSTVDYANLGSIGWQYITGFSIEDSSFFAAPNDVILNSIEPGSFKVINASLDSATNSMYIKSSYKNLSGNERIVEESLTLH